MLRLKQTLLTAKRPNENNFLQKMYFKINFEKYLYLFQYLPLNAHNAHQDNVLKSFVGSLCRNVASNRMVSRKNIGENIKIDKPIERHLTIFGSKQVI